LTPEQLFADRSAVMLRELPPLLGLGRQNEIHHVTRDQAERAVIILVAAPAVAAGRDDAIRRGRFAKGFGLRSAGIGAVLEIESSKERSETSGLMQLPRARQSYPSKRPR
jgi:hypothetical protein